MSDDFEQRAAALDTERKLAELAAYHAGLFIGRMMHIDSSPAAIAHALFLLIEQAKLRREEWLRAVAGRVK
jgi:hypothetical protein